MLCAIMLTGRRTNDPENITFSANLISVAGSQESKCNHAPIQSQQPQPILSVCELMHAEEDG